MDIEFGNERGNCEKMNDVCVIGVRIYENRNDWEHATTKNKRH